MFSASYGTTLWAKGDGMARMVMCKKLGKELPGLTFKPFPNELGQRIYDSSPRTPGSSGSSTSR